ncbi:hypothetical protein ACIQWL_52050 [Streptomyces mirabilis]|uniref:hypothetical protein n=1 Tax=Streptomyces mirabilis TaxID=68239 RepID=UPI000A5B3747|nr:hypothetical protein [Streptomyces mirabilis]
MGSLVALLVALVLTAAAPAADGPGETGLRFEAPGTFVMYNADEGAKAENAAFVLPVAVVPGNTGPARGGRVGTASGLRRDWPGWPAVLIPAVLAAVAVAAAGVIHRRRRRAVAVPGSSANGERSGS